MKTWPVGGGAVASTNALHHEDVRDADVLVPVFSPFSRALEVEMNDSK